MVGGTTEAAAAYKRASVHCHHYHCFSLLDSLIAFNIKPEMLFIFNFFVRSVQSAGRRVPELALQLSNYGSDCFKNRSVCEEKHNPNIKVCTFLLLYPIVHALVGNKNGNPHFHNTNSQE